MLAKILRMVDTSPANQYKGLPLHFH